LAGDNARAISQYEAIIEKRPHDPMALNNLAWIYHLTQDARAERTARLAYEEAPTSAAIADTYGWILVANGKAAEGAKLLAEAARRAPREPDIQYHYAIALARTGAVDEARQRLSQVLKDFPAFTARAEAEKALSELAEGTRAAS
jgi:cellulose synthase operon protein C